MLLTMLVQGRRLCRNKRLWRSAFARFLTAYGITRLAKGCEIDTSAVYHWIRGASAPKPAHAAIIQRLARESGTKLTLDQIYQHAQDLRAGERESVAIRKFVREHSFAAHASAK
jgi:hypothetical protein